MKHSFIRFSDLPTVSVETSPLLPGATQCVVRCRGVEQVHMMLFAEGIVSLFAMRLEPADEVAEALARFVIRHALNHSEAGADLIADIKEQASDPCEALAWKDLPVSVSAPRSVGKVTCYPLATPDTAALVLSTDDPLMPISFVAVTDAKPCRPLYVAIGRTLIGHHLCLLKKQPELQG